MDHGRLHNVVGGRDYALGQNQALIVPPDQWHMQYGEEGERVGFITASFTCAGPLPEEILLRVLDRDQTARELARALAAEEEREQPYRGDLLVAVETETMGRGSDELGRTLMKGFLFAVGQLPQLPKTILFYNGGAHLTVEGSPVLEDLKKLEAQGVEILTCGTCLNFYGLTDRLAVGGVTNMYDIVERLASAGKVIKP